MWFNTILLLGVLVTTAIAEQSCVDLISCPQPEVRRSNNHRHNRLHERKVVTEYVTAYATHWINGPDDLKTIQPPAVSAPMIAATSLSPSSAPTPPAPSPLSSPSTSMYIVSSSIDVYTQSSVTTDQRKSSTKATTLLTRASSPTASDVSKPSSTWSYSSSYSSSASLVSTALIPDASMSPTDNNAKAVFAHYMVGEITYAEAQVDISEAISMGLDAFALNVQSSDDWVNQAITNLFEIADAKGFKLFLSFDMSYFQNPADFFDLLESCYSNSAYYKYNGLPFVSTFYGGTLTFGYPTVNDGWQALYRDALDAKGMPTYFVPSFEMSTDTSSLATLGNFWDSFSMADGQFNWDGSWPYISQGMVNVSCTDDDVWIAEAAKNTKTYMMGLSSLQFKHLDSDNNWFRRGGLSLALRITQILNSQPDFVEIQTWNDGGESHYIGNVWPDMISTTDIGSYITGYNHTGWQNVLGPFSTAYKNGAKTAADVVPINGKTTQGVFWHATLLVGATCSSDPLGQPVGYELMADVIEVALTVAKGATASVKVYSGGNLLATKKAVEGLNAWEVSGMTVGDVRVVVEDGTGKVLSDETGAVSVLSDASLCNYNPQVVGL